MMTLRVEKLSKSYTTPSGTLPVLSEVSLSFHAGDAVAITGPSGSGKSTFLHILGTLDAPTIGTLHFGETNPFTLSELDRARHRNLKLGFVFQDHHLLPQCTVLENVLIPTLVNPEPGTDFVKRAEELLERVGLSARKNHRPGELSGGERQRAAVARALIRKPALVLADEPTGNLDHANATSLGELLISLPQEQGTMLVVVTHSQELAARFPRQFVVTNGTLVEKSKSGAHS